MANSIAKPISLAIAAGITLGGVFGAGSPAFAQDGTVPSVAEEATQVLRLRPRFQPAAISL